MRAQASLEFILVLSAISVLCLAMVAAYNGNASSLKQSFGNALNTSNVEAPAEPGIAQKPGVFFYVPQNSTTLKANKMQIAAMGCQNGTMTAHFISPEVLFSQNSLKMSESGLNIASLYFTPLSQGYNQVEVLYNSTCGNDTKSYSSNFTTYSAISGGQGNPVSADITNRSEYFLYKISSGGNIFGINEFSHCTVRGMGDPLPISAQCGADSWGYSVFSDYCYTESNYYTMTYCIEPVGTNYSTAYINPSNYSLKYSLGLGIYYEGQSLSSNLSGNTASPLLIANRSVGYSKVLSATGVDSPPYTNFVAFKTDQMSVSGQAYSEYDQAKNNLYSTLSFYNGSEVSTDTQNIVESAVSAYVHAEENLINSTLNASSGCTINSTIYSCKAAYPLSYQIEAVANGIGIPNSSLEYAGSIIDVKSS